MSNNIINNSNDNNNKKHKITSQTVINNNLSDYNNNNNNNTQLDSAATLTIQSKTEFINNTILTTTNNTNNTVNNGKTITASKVASIGIMNTSISSSLTPTPIITPSILRQTKAKEEMPTAASTITLTNLTTKDTSIQQSQSMNLINANLDPNLFTFKPKLNPKTELLTQNIAGFYERQNLHIKKQLDLVSKK